MSTQQPADEKSLRSQLFLPALLLAAFAAITFTVFLSNALVDVASTLKVTVGTASQILTISSFVGLIIGFPMGFLAVRFKHKSLFLLGVVVFGFGALGSFFAPDFASMLFFSLLLGIGQAMVDVMIFTLIGDFLPLEKRGIAVGSVIGAIFVAQIVMPQVTSAITISAGWRFVLLWFIFPIVIVSLVFGFLILPSKPRQEQTDSKPQYLEAFKQVLSNKSALSCQVATTLQNYASIVPIYAVTFYILDFKTSLSTATIFYSIASVMGILGVLVGGRLINRIGRKPLTVVTALISGIFAVLFVFVPNVWVSVAMWMLGAAFASANAAGLVSLSLEQVPSFRGTMMSLNTSFRYIGLIVGLTISGLILNLYANNFQIIYAIIGAASIASAVVVFLFAKDPCKTQSSPSFLIEN